MSRLRDKIDKIKSWYPIIQSKNEEIEYYKKLVFPDKKLNIADQFLVYSTDFDEENVDIICKHLREFGKLAYKYGHKLIARQECDDEIAIYLVPFNDNYDMETTLDEMDLLIERKRNEYEEANVWPSKRIVPEVKMINTKIVEMANKMDESDKSINRMSEKLEEKMLTNMTMMNEHLEIVKEETTNVQRTLDEFQVQSDAQLNEMKSSYELALRMLHSLQKQSMKSEERRRSLEVSRFYGQRNLEYIRSSPVILEKICLTLSCGSEDKIWKEHLLKDMQVQKKELIKYFDLLQNSLEASNQTEIQKSIKDLMSLNWTQLLYKPTTSEKDEWKNEMKQKLGIENTVGTVCYITYIWEKKEGFFFFCIANSKIICWNCGESKEDALQSVHKNLKDLLNWDTNAKFATDMDVSGDLSEYFVHVSTDELMEISDNQKVMEWMNNNFEFWKYNLKECYHHSIPAIYSLALQYFEESLED